MYFIVLGGSVVFDKEAPSVIRDVALTLADSLAPEELEEAALTVPVSKCVCDDDDDDIL